MKKSSYTKFQHIVAFLLFFSHTLISCSCKRNSDDDRKQPEQPNKQSTTEKCSTSSPAPNTNNQTNPSATSSTPSEATHETATNPANQPDVSIPITEENPEAHLTEDEVLTPIPFSTTEELVSADDEKKKDDNQSEAVSQHESTETYLTEEKVLKPIPFSTTEELVSSDDGRKKDDNQSEAVSQHESTETYLTEEKVLKPIPFSTNQGLVSSDEEKKKDDNQSETVSQSDNLIPDLKHSDLVKSNQPAPILFSPLFQHTPDLPQKDNNLPTNIPSTHSSNNPPNKTNPIIINPNSFFPSPNIKPSVPTEPEKKLATISPIKNQLIPFVEEQQALAQHQQQVRQQQPQNLGSEIEKKQNGSPDPSRPQSLLKPFSTVSHELATAGKQKEWETSYQQVVADELLVSAADKQKEWETSHQQLVADELLVSAADKQKEWETNYQQVVADEFLVSAADKQKEWETSHQQVVADEFLVSAADKQKEWETSHQQLVADELLVSAADKQKEWETNYQQVVADEFLVSVADNQKERETSYQPVVANDVLVSAADSSALQLNTPETKQQDQASKNLLEQLEQQPDCTESPPNDSRTDKFNIFFNQICTEINNFFSDPTHRAELDPNAQQQVQELLRLIKLSETNSSQSGQEDLQQKASVLIEALLDLPDKFKKQLNDLNSQKKSLKELYLKELYSNSDYINSTTLAASKRISSLKNKIENIKKSIETTEKAVSQLFNALTIIETDPKPSTSTVPSPAIE